MQAGGESRSRDCVLLVAREQNHWHHARRLINEYAHSLGLDLSFQHFEHELDNLESEYAPPSGAFILAMEDHQFVGCAGLRRFGEGAGEIKRLYLVPQARGRAIGRMLAEAIVDAARKIGYDRLLLDTLPSMAAAQSLYLSLGFEPVEAYRYNPIEGTTFLELKLQQLATEAGRRAVPCREKVPHARRQSSER